VGETIEYTYNANGDATSTVVKSASATVVKQQSALFDELGRLMRSIGAASQQTNYGYDRTDKLVQSLSYSCTYDGVGNCTSDGNTVGDITQSGMPPPGERRTLIAGRVFIHNVNQRGLLKTGERLPRPAEGLPSLPSSRFMTTGMGKKDNRNIHH
jgi:hypothetical protein